MIEMKCFMGVLNKIMKILLRVGQIPETIFKVDSDNQTELLAIGKLLSNQQKQIDSDNIQDYEFKIFSQAGEDGIIQFLVNHVEIKNKIFIEFGVEDYVESNTRFLMMNNNWSGLVMDGAEANIKKIQKSGWLWKYDLEAKAAFVDIDNINNLISSPKYIDIGILSIDIDGNDYHILKQIDMKKLNPSILILEYNSVFGDERKITVPYDKVFFRTKAHYSNLYFGASLPALTDLADTLGYSLVGSNSIGSNAFYVRKDLLNEKIREKTVKESYVKSKFRESRNKDCSLSFLGGDDRYFVIKGLKVLNTDSGLIEDL